MKSVYFAFLFLGLFAAGATAREKNDGRAPAWAETVQSEGAGTYRVQMDTQQKKVEVVREDQKAGVPPQLRLRLLRKNDRPFEVKLHLVDRPKNELPRYSGDASMWEGSVVGFQLEFSFDKKTWKRVGKTINKVLP